MMHITVVENDLAMSRQFRSYFDQYKQAYRTKIGSISFLNNSKFSGTYGSSDIIFLDVETPEKDGMEIAQRIREHYPDVILLLTSAAIQHAVEGYSVQALDFMLKPISFHEFSRCMTRAIRLAQQQPIQKNILGQMKRVPNI